MKLAIHSLVVIEGRALGASETTLVCALMSGASLAKLAQAASFTTFTFFADFLLDMILGALFFGVRLVRFLGVDFLRRLSLCRFSYASSLLAKFLILSLHFSTALRSLANGLFVVELFVELALAAFIANIRRLAASSIFRYILPLK